MRWPFRKVEVAEVEAEDQVTFLRKENDFVEYLEGVYGCAARYLDHKLELLACNEISLKRNIDKLRARSGRRNQRRLGKRQQELVRVQGEREQIRLEQATVDQSLTNSLREQYGLIRQIPRVLDAMVIAPRFVLVTDVLFGKDGSGKWRRIGPMQISYDLRNPGRSSFAWKNLEGARGGFEAPPNISVAQNPCIGTVATKILMQAVSARDHVSLCKLLVRYPECRGSKDVISNWPEVTRREVPDWYLQTTFESADVAEWNGVFGG